MTEPNQTEQETLELHSEHYTTYYTLRHDRRNQKKRWRND